MDTQALLRTLPGVDELLKREDVLAALDVYPRVLVIESLREAIDAKRAAIVSGDAAEPDAATIVGEALGILASKSATSLRRVINATGVVVHTNLGRAPLAPSAVEAVVAVARGYSTLEYDVPAGARGSRHTHVEGLLCRLTGAEAAMAVNNNAAAVLLVLTALASGKEAIVSRGQLVEVGGSFRIPDIMRQSGAKMIEVGATNKTRLSDYEAAVTPETGLLLKVHSSNFRMVGFTEEASVEELVRFGAAQGIPVFEDQGSGVLIDLAEFGLPGEPTVRSSVEAGASLVSFSGDKLLGGPQAGLIVGKGHIVEELKRHPLSRALRCDKMTLAALEATLRLYLEPDRAVAEIPVLRMLTQPVAVVAERAARLADGIAHACVGSLEVTVMDEVSRAGGGALPMADVPTVVVALKPLGFGVEELESRLRLGEPAVIARISEDRLLLDPRTLLNDEELECVSAVARAACGVAG